MLGGKIDRVVSLGGGGGGGGIQRYVIKKSEHSSNSNIAKIVLSFPLFTENRNNPSFHNSANKNIINLWLKTSEVANLLSDDVDHRHLCGNSALFEIVLGRW